jgi:DNA repair exonuclease SbcCD ATPase subunit
MGDLVTALQRITARYLQAIAGGDLSLRLELDCGEGGDRIVRRVLVRTGADGADGRPQFVERSLSSVSGGQWRRCSLAFTLGFAELCARRGRLQSSLLILDEPLTHLDPIGQAAVGEVLRSMVHRDAKAPQPFHQRSTIIVILQGLAAEEMSEVFDSVDTITKEDGRPLVRVDGMD